MDDPAFLSFMRQSLSGLPGVEAVMLGGSRAYGRENPDSDWDFSTYYRKHFDVGRIRAFGWPGQVFEIGGWGGGVFNGGAWLDIAGRRVDIHYRDLEDIERRIGEAQRGEFAIEPLLRAGWAKADAHFAAAGSRPAGLVGLLDHVEALVHGGRTPPFISDSRSSTL